MFLDFNFDSLVSFNKEIQENIGYWDELKEKLKWESRYLTNLSELTDLGWDGFFNSKLTLRSTDTYYRARLHKIADEDAYPKEKMYSPDKIKTAAGRANPLGSIPYLYLSNNQDTVLYEVRASFLDEVSIGKFKIKDDSEEILISDFTENLPLYGELDDLHSRIKSTLLKQKISEDLSKPIRRYDSEIDYIPTQFICEFIKVYTNVHGIKFKSSLHESGNNLVIFDQEEMECINVSKVKISNVEIASKDI